MRPRLPAPEPRRKMQESLRSVGKQVVFGCLTQRSSSSLLRPTSNFALRTIGGASLFGNGGRHILDVALNLLNGRMHVLEQFVLSIRQMPDSLGLLL